MENENIIKSTRNWLEQFVVDLNICPFAKRVLTKNKIRFSISVANTEEQLLLELKNELEYLEKNVTAETTLLIHARVLQDFFEYNEFLEIADELLIEMNLEGVFQIASFHPDYQFAGTNPKDAENYTNRSPYPMLHILREDSLEQAIANYPDVEQIPIKNIAVMNALGKDKIESLMRTCLIE
ncbi:MAG: DUF1415 domain-containing protein [Gammaproteobacteria bacterium]